jgi:hypothetical protein
MSLFTPLDDAISDLGDLFSVEMFSGIATDLNYLIDCVPPGKIAMIVYGVTGVPLPDSKYWQECDGAAITDPDSPLRGGNTPDMATLGRYLRGYDSIGNVGTTGGSNTKALSHSHTGLTNVMNTYIPDNMKTDSDNDEFNGDPTHKHSISSDLSTLNFEPPHVRVRFFLKIN